MAGCQPSLADDPIPPSIQHPTLGTRAPVDWGEAADAG